MQFGDLPILEPSKAALMDIATVAEKLGPRVLAALDVKFNGSLTQVRYPDENDLLF